MKTLYESILDPDFDIKEEDVKELAMRQVVVDSNYGEEDIEYQLLHGNQLIIDHPGGPREYAFDILVDGMNKYNVGVVEFKKECILRYTPNVLSNLTIIGHKWIKLGVFYRQLKTQLKDVELLSAGPMDIRGVSMSIDRKTKLQCTNLNLIESTLSIKTPSQIIADEIRIAGPGRSYKSKMRKVGLLDLYENMYTVKKYDFSDIDPAELFFGKPLDKPFKIIVAPEMYSSGTGLVFIKKGYGTPRSHDMLMFDMKNTWICYVCDKIGYDIY